MSDGSGGVEGGDASGNIDPAVRHQAAAGKYSDYL
jgi:hypothetical protein